MGGISLIVLSQEGAWRVKVGEALSPPYRSHSEAVRSAMDRATKISRDGFNAEVVMKVMTCEFGPNGFFRTIPTPLHAKLGGSEVTSATLSAPEDHDALISNNHSRRHGEREALQQAIDALAEELTGEAEFYWNKPAQGRSV